MISKLPKSKVFLTSLGLIFISSRILKMIDFSLKCESIYCSNNKVKFVHLQGRQGKKPANRSGMNFVLNLFSEQLKTSKLFYDFSFFLKFKVGNAQKVLRHARPLLEPQTSNLPVSELFVMSSAHNSRLAATPVESPEVFESSSSTSYLKNQLNFLSSAFLLSSKKAKNGESWRRR